MLLVAKKFKLLVPMIFLPTHFVLIPTKISRAFPYSLLAAPGIQVVLKHLTQSLFHRSLFFKWFQIYGRLIPPSSSSARPNQ